jgi:hypothetical protein
VAVQIGGQDLIVYAEVSNVPLTPQVLKDLALIVSALGIGMGEAYIGELAVGVVHPVVYLIVQLLVLRDTDDPGQSSPAGGEGLTVHGAAAGV